MRGTNMIVEILKIGAAVAVGLPVFLYFYQEKMLFYPTPPVTSLPRAARGDVETVRLTAQENYDWLKKENYGYIIIDGQTVKYFGANETSNKLITLAI